MIRGFAAMHRAPMSGIIFIEVDMTIDKNIWTNRKMKVQSIHQLHISALIMGIIIFIMSGCGAHNVRLTAPELIDEIPPIRTGFYTVHKIVDGQVSDTPGSTLTGEMIYLYKDQYFVDETFFMGVKGSFLPNYRIITMMIDKNVHLAGFGAVYLLVILVSYVPIAIAPEARIPTQWFPFLLPVAALCQAFAMFIATLIQYGKGGKDNE